MPRINMWNRLDWLFPVTLQGGVDRLEHKAHKARLRTLRALSQSPGHGEALHPARNRGGRLDTAGVAAVIRASDKRYAGVVRVSGVRAD